MKIRNVPIASALFIQGGPGQSADVERQWFAQIPTLSFWEGPHFSPDHTGAFSEWVNAAAEKLGEHALAQPNGRTHLIGWSFAGHVLRQLADRHPDRIASLTLLASTTDPCVSAAALGEKIAPLAAFPEKVRSLAIQLGVSRTLPAYWELVGALLTIPGFTRTHWSPDSAEELARFESLAAGAASILDLDTFTAITNDFVAKPPKMKRSGFSGPVYGFWGKHDPFLNPVTQQNAWRVAFPQLQATAVPSGHYIHFETAPSIWMPKLI